MCCARNVPGILTSAALSGTFAMLGGLIAVNEYSPPLLDVSCFTIGAVVECIDAGFIMPPMIVAGPNTEGTDETLTIEDNGGYHEVRG